MILCLHRYIFLLNTLSGGKSCSVAPGVAVPPWATETVLSPWFAADEARVSHVLSHVVWWKNKIYICIYIYTECFTVWQQIITRACFVEYDRTLLSIVFVSSFLSSRIFSVIQGQFGVIIVPFFPSVFNNTLVVFRGCCLWWLFSLNISFLNWVVAFFLSFVCLCLLHKIKIKIHFPSPLCLNENYKPLNPAWKCVAMDGWVV